MLLHILLNAFLLSVLPCSACPDCCYCDEGESYVSCKGSFPENLPRNITRLELMDIAANKTPLERLQDYSDVKELKLQQCHIEAIENTTFSWNTLLEKLDLSQNLLTRIDSSLFAELTSLRFLDLSTNLVQYVEFVSILNLEQLNLRDNHLSQLTSQSFPGLVKVQYLNLDSNFITNIEVGTFQYFTNLTHLILSNNPLKTLSRLDFFGSRLQYIDISETGLVRIPQSLTKFVRDLRLAKNKVERVSSGDFDSYPYLGLLVLDSNGIKEIEEDALGRLEYLVRLWLNGNRLTEVPANLPESLLDLYVEENKLGSLLAYGFKGLQKLEQLFLQRNEIRIIQSCAFCDLVSLKSLDLQANFIENLTGDIFSPLTQLQSLDLSQNNLKVIESKSFVGLNRLISLQMSRVHSTVVQLDESSFDPLRKLEILEIYNSPVLVQKILNSTRLLNGLRNVQDLNFMHNSLSKIRSDFSSFFPLLKIVKLAGNLWFCDQTMVWLLNWMKQSSVQFYSNHNVQCAGPSRVQFKPILSLNYEDFLTGNSPVISSEVVTSTTAEEPIDSSTSTLNLIFTSTPKANFITAALPLANIPQTPAMTKRVISPLTKTNAEPLTDAVSPSAINTTNGGPILSWTLSGSNATALARTFQKPERPYRTLLVLGGAFLGTCGLLVIAVTLLWLQRQSIYYRPQADEMSTVALTEHHGLYHISECGTIDRRSWENTKIQST